jgi:protein gp37
MSANSKIEWTHHTFNPWWGCAKVSPGCDHCYAERDAGRFAPGKTLWGVDAARREFSDKHWAEPLKWNAQAALYDAPRQRVFCASMADIFDKNAPAGARDRLWKLIKATPYLDWLLLTKRIGNAKGMLPADWGDGYPNVWMGISVVNQEEADRDIPKLLALPARLRWLSCEPLLGAIDLRSHLFEEEGGRIIMVTRSAVRIEWVVVGGESGSQARPMQAAWARFLRDQCRLANVAFLFKQWGEWGLNWRNDDSGHPITGSEWMDRMGKKLAGRTLDGVVHDGYPLVQHEEFDESEGGHCD